MLELSEAVQYFETNFLEEIKKPEARELETFLDELERQVSALKKIKEDDNNLPANSEVAHADLLAKYNHYTLEWSALEENLRVKNGELDRGAASFGDRTNFTEGEKRQLKDLGVTREQVGGIDEQLDQLDPKRELIDFLWNAYCHVWVEACALCGFVDPDESFMSTGSVVDTVDLRPLVQAALESNKQPPRLSSSPMAAEKRRIAAALAPAEGVSFDGDNEDVLDRRGDSGITGNHYPSGSVHFIPRPAAGESSATTPESAADKKQQQKNFEDAFEETTPNNGHLRSYDAPLVDGEAGGQGELLLDSAGTVVVIGQKGSAFSCSSFLDCLKTPGPATLTAGFGTMILSSIVGVVVLETVVNMSLAMSALLVTPAFIGVLCLAALACVGLIFGIVGAGISCRDKATFKPSSNTCFVDGGYTTPPGERAVTTITSVEDVVTPQ